MYRTVEAACIWDTGTAAVALERELTHMEHVGLGEVPHLAGELLQRFVVAIHEAPDHLAGYASVVADEFGETPFVT